MSKLNRYKFAKKCYKDYVVMLLIKDKLYTYIDNKFVKKITYKLCYIG